ncbi:MAG TPA: membrane protein insertion efficiency factor YidD [Flavobacteriales bacterium]|nr:membrane protein insertion efficiency factor YidD [Flavobacteriales bacterium]
MKWIISRIFLFMIKFYQLTISPLNVSTCRFNPTCSQYSVEAIQKHGPFKGGLYALKRIFSCNPWGKHGHDPVP